MRRIVVVFITLGLLIQFNSCDRRNLVIEVKDVDYSNNDKLILSSTDCGEIIGVTDIFISDTLLLVITNDDKGQLKVLRTRDLSLVVDLCRRGRASDEFTQRPVRNFWEIYEKDGCIVMPLIDGVSTLKELNITESVIHGRTVINKKEERPPFMNCEIMRINDEKSLYYYPVSNDDPQSEKYYPPKYYIVDNESKSEIKVFSKIMDAVWPSAVINAQTGIMHKHPNKNLFVQNFERMDYLIYFDLNNNHYYAIHQKGSHTFDDVLPGREEYKKKWRKCFTDAVVTNNYIISLYWNDDYCEENINTGEKKSIIKVFDWNGNYVYGAKLDKAVHSIAYDEIHNILFGINRSTEKLFSFKLNLPR